MDTHKMDNLNNLSNVTTSQNGISFNVDIASTVPSVRNQGATGEDQAETYTLVESYKTEHQQDIDYAQLSPVTITTNSEHSMEQVRDIPWKSSNVKTTKNGISFDIKYTFSCPLLTQSESATKEKRKTVQTHLQFNKTDQKQNFDSIDYTKLSSATTKPHRAEGENQATDKLTTISKDIALSTRIPTIFPKVSSTRAKHRTLEEITQKLFDAAERRQKHYQNYDVRLKVNKVMQNRIKMFTSYRQLIETRLSSKMQQYADRRSRKILSIQRKAQSENSKLKIAVQKVEMAREKIIRNYSKKLEKMKNITKLKDPQYFVNMKSKRDLPRSFKLLDNRKSKQQKSSSVAKSNKEIAVKVTNQSRDHYKDRFELFANVSQLPALIQTHPKRIFNTKVSKQQEAAENVTKVVKKKCTSPRKLEKTTLCSSTLQNEASKEKSELKQLKKAKTTLESRKPCKFEKTMLCSSTLQNEASKGKSELKQLEKAKATLESRKPCKLEKTMPCSSTLQNEASKGKSELKQLKKAKATLESRKPCKSEKTMPCSSTLQNEASKGKSELKQLKKAKATLESRKPWRN